MDVDNNQKLRFWLFEHACKYNMETVLKHLSADKGVFEKLCDDPSELVKDEFPYDASFMFLKLLSSFISSLEAGVYYAAMDVTGQTWNKKLHYLVVDLLSTTYQQKHYISTRHFVHLITRLRLMALLRLCYEGCSSSEIAHGLNESFPRWNAECKQAFQANYKIKDEKVLEKLQKAYSESRKFILRLTISEVCRKTYLTEHFEEDMKKFSKQAALYLNRVLRAVRSKIGLTMIEKIVSGACGSDPSYADDPAVMMVQEYVDSCLVEDNILQLAQAIDAGSDMHWNDDTNSLHGDNASDIGSECDTCMDEEETISVDDIDAEDSKRRVNELAGSTQPFEMSLDQSGILASSGESASRNLLEVISDSEPEGDDGEEEKSKGGVD